MPAASTLASYESRSITVADLSFGQSDSAVGLLANPADQFERDDWPARCFYLKSIRPASVVHNISVTVADSFGDSSGKQKASERPGSGDLMRGHYSKGQKTGAVDPNKESVRWRATCHVSLSARQCGATRRQCQTNWRVGAVLRNRVFSAML
jgi:hypothetical protein